jgi:20S proteasome alpha/beta subunit
MLERSSIVNKEDRENNACAVKDLRSLVFDTATGEWEHRPPIFDGGSMTVCIAALCEGRKSVVCATDRMISSDFSASDTAMFKFQHIHEDWAVMFAASDASPIQDILAVGRQRMEKTDGTLAFARREITQAYRDVRLQKAEAQYLSGRGWTLDRFYEEGRALLGDPNFTAIERRINEYQLGVDLLVVGHGEDKKGHIFTIENPGRDDDRSIPGFWAIGSGAINAVSSLYQRGMNPATYVHKALYLIYEAKQYAQKVGGVGPTTDIWILRPDAKGHLESKEIEGELEKVWQEVQPKVVNKTVLANLIDLLSKDKEPDAK